MSDHPYKIERCFIGDALGIEEEGFCDTCGSPQVVGDEAFQVIGQRGDIVAFGFCTRACAQAEVAEWVDLGAELAEKGGAV